MIEHGACDAAMIWAARRKNKTVGQLYRLAPRYGYIHWAACVLQVNRRIRNRAWNAVDNVPLEMGSEARQKLLAKLYRSIVTYDVLLKAY